MSDEKKADGWVAWHPSLMAPNYVWKRKGRWGGVIRWMGGHSFRVKGVPTPFHGRDNAINGALEIGWRIRPVKLIFLDEDDE